MFAVVIHKILSPPQTGANSNYIIKVSARHRWD